MSLRLNGYEARTVLGKFTNGFKKKPIISIYYLCPKGHRGNLAPPKVRPFRPKSAQLKGLDGSHRID